MASTDLATILARVSTVLEADPLNLVATAEPFSHDRAPNTVMDRAYRVQDGGLVSSQPCGNYKAARIDRVIVFVAKKLNFAGLSSVETMEGTLSTIERALKADGVSNDYHAELEARLVTPIPNTDAFVGSLSFTVDYDYDEAVQ